jgi:hypothetical protein
MKKIIIGIFVILFLSLLVSCGVARSMGISLKKNYVYFDYDRFKEERALWNSTKPANYQFNYEINVYDTSDTVGFDANTLIIVENGKYKTQIPNYTDDETGYTSRSYRNETINDIYEYIEKLYLKYNNKTPPRGRYLEEIEIEYDMKNHIPIGVRMWFTFSGFSLDDSSSYDTIMITEYKKNN